VPIGRKFRNFTGYELVHTFDSLIPEYVSTHKSTLMTLPVRNKSSSIYTPPHCLIFYRLKKYYKPGYLVSREMTYPSFGI
jgi:hypothetical protein